MKNRYRGKTCVYCCSPGASQSADHVIARKFFLERMRGNLPKVPACDPCNRAKADLERYLTAVLPFGAVHPDATETLDSMVQARLENDLRLARELNGGIGYRVGHAANGLLFPSMTIPFDHEPLRKLYEFIARGLAYSMWGLSLPPDQVYVHAEFLSPVGAEMFQQLFQLGMQARASENYGGGVFRFEAAMAKDPNELTVWRMSLYGAKLSDDVAGEAVTDAYVLTAPRRMKAASDLVRLMSQPRAA